MAADETGLDALILGGGIAGLWILDALTQRGMSAVVVEPFELGAGQTLWSQGIIHGGTKYSLSGLLSGSAEAIRDMPARWRDCLAGRGRPDLSTAHVRSDHCYLWQTTGMRSALGMLGARIGLRTAPHAIPEADRPQVLRDCPGTVARLDEQVVDPASVLAALAGAHPGRILKVDSPESIEVQTSPGGGGDIGAVVLRRPGSGETRVIRPRVLILAAGAGNESWRIRLGLPAQRSQSRPLHMVLLRGPGDALPRLFGHCIDGARTRVTITSAEDSRGRTIWQIGGEVAEAGIKFTPEALIAHARRELAAVLPGLRTESCEWSAYLAPRAEAATPNGRRPEDAVAIREGDVITAWPTKLALAPRLAETVAEMLANDKPIGPPSGFLEWPAPEVAPPPWEQERPWISDLSARSG